MWLFDRLCERTSQAAIAAGLTHLALVASQPTAWEAGALPQWLTLVQPLTVCLIAILVPEGPGLALPSLSKPNSPVAPTEPQVTL